MGEIVLGEAPPARPPARPAPFTVLCLFHVSFYNSCVTCIFIWLLMKSVSGSCTIALTDSKPVSKYAEMYGVETATVKSVINIGVRALFTETACQSKSTSRIARLDLNVLDVILAIL